MVSVSPTAVWEMDNTSLLLSLCKYRQGSAFKELSTGSWHTETGNKPSGDPKEDTPATYRGPKTQAKLCENTGPYGVLASLPV